MPEPTPETMTCPVPHEQQPLNEYLALQESWFFRWGAMPLWNYLKVAATIWLMWWLVSGPVAAVSFPFRRHPAEFLCLGSIGATFGLSLPLLRLFLGWVYVKDRLLSPIVTYEESGWYDGQQWTKPEMEWMKDRLLVSYTIQPILDKLQTTFVVLFAFAIVLIVMWQLI